MAPDMKPNGVDFCLLFYASSRTIQMILEMNCPKLTMILSSMFSCCLLLADHAVRCTTNEHQMQQDANSLPEMACPNSNMVLFSAFICCLRCSLSLMQMSMKACICCF